MSIFLLIVLGLPVLDAAWWWWADRRLRGLRRPFRWRVLLAVFVGSNLALYAWLLTSRMVRLPIPMPVALLIVTYVWHLAVLPATVLAVFAYEFVRVLIKGGGLVARLLGERREALAEPPITADSVDGAVFVDPVDPPETPDAVDPRETPADSRARVLTRRQVLAAAAVALPPIATAAAHAHALWGLDDFRIRRMDIDVPTLPPALDGMTIAHVSDIHVGRFTSGKLLRRVVERTNALRADLVLMTGDLIDFSLADLPAGVDVLKRLDPRHGLFMCEGNHDLFDSRLAFEQGVRAAGVPLLLNETATVTIRGQAVQILGLRWGNPQYGHDPRIREQMENLLELRQPGAFPILLAHHPHAFDPAVDGGLPLMLAGHTHGGQLMLTKDLGAGSLLFKYWSGLYRRKASALVVSNGVGNWFPLRINAPAEVVHVTLHAPTEPSAASGIGRTSA